MCHAWLLLYCCCFWMLLPSLLAWIKLPIGKCQGAVLSVVVAGFVADAFSRAAAVAAGMGEALPAGEPVTRASSSCS
jgi:hypothetical protein